MLSPILALDMRPDDLRGPAIAALLAEHLADMRRVTPPESVHALDLDGLRRPEITFWCAFDGEALAGCGALKDLGGGHGEVKSMRTARAYRRRGVAAAILAHAIGVATGRGRRRLSLETGAMAFFAPAHRLYESFGFARCGPFDGYTDDPNSVFMTRDLA
jgi:putative acetyltransferase